MSAYSDLVLSKASLSAYYRLNEASGTVLDDVGPNNLDGTIAASGVTYGVTGALANDSDDALTFDGTNGTATVTDNAALDLGDGPFWISLWVKRSATQSAEQHLISKGTNAYAVLFSAGNFLAFAKQGVATVARSGSTITDQNWHFVVVNKNGSTREVYIDGVASTTLFTDNTLADTANNFVIAGSAGVRFPGSMDEVAVGKGATLSAAEVLELFNVGKGIVSQASENDSAQAVSRLKRVTLGQQSETDTAQAISESKRKDVAQASETDAAQSVTGRHTATLGQASESDEAQPITAGETFAVTQASETDAAHAISVSKSVTLGQATETDEAQAVEGGEEEEPPQTGIGTVAYVTPRKLRQWIAVAQAQELDFALPIQASQSPSRVQIEDDELLLIV